MEAALQDMMRGPDLAALMVMFPEILDVEVEIVDEDAPEIEIIYEAVDHAIDRVLDDGFAESWFASPEDVVALPALVEDEAASFDPYRGVHNLIAIGLGTAAVVALIAALL